MKISRICSFDINNRDDEPFIEVRHCSSEYISILTIDEHGGRKAIIDLDYEEAAAIAYALTELLRFHGPEQNKAGTGT